MPGMLAHFWKRSEQAKKVRLEKEVIDSAKARHLTEIAYFAKDSVEGCQAWVDAQSRHEKAVETLLKFERE